MRKNTKKAVCILFAVLLLACSFPISAFAVDPLSASVIANGFAQAITAYGASNGVSLTFDSVNSGNTSQIGQTVHELWKSFREGQMTADDYDTIAAAVVPGLYNKVVKAGGTAVVGMHIAAEYMPDIDAFWNWLLSGPAEMVKVDNAYQWTPDPTTNAITPIQVYYGSNINGIAVAHRNIYTLPASSSSGADFHFRAEPEVEELYAYRVDRSGSKTTVFFSLTQGVTVYYCTGKTYVDKTWEPYRTPSQSFTVNGVTYVGRSIARSTPDIPLVAMVNGSYNPKDILGITDAIPSAVAQNASVQPYVGDAVANPVPIPDNDDPDYGPLPWAGDLDMPWNDLLYGPGDRDLTDEELEDLIGDLDDEIVDDKTLLLEGDETTDEPGTGTEDPPSSDPGDYGVVGLETVFPFCIPFDIYNFLNALSAAPTAPHFTATLQLPAALGGAQTIDLDFDNPTFNQLAQLLRLLELLAFIVGLALLTRSMFIRG